MRPLSALEAISPAWAHTSSLLLAPRSWRLLLKIGLIACLAGIGSGGSNLHFPGTTHSMHPLHPMHPIHAGHMSLPLILTGVLAVTVLTLLGLSIAFAFLYLGSRLQFVLFDVLLTRTTTVGPIWKRYGGVTWRWIGLRLLCFLALMLCLAPILLPAAVHFFHVFAAYNSGQDINLYALIPSILGFIAAALLVGLAATAALTLVFDFGLPSIALDNTSIAVTLKRVLALFRSEPTQCLLYLLLRFLLAIACGLVAEMCLAVAAFITALPFGGVAAVLWGTLHTASHFGRAFMIGGWILLGLIFLTLFVCAAIMVIGYIRCFLGSYALFFLAGRYPKLGQILEQHLPPPAPLYAAPYSPFGPTQAPAR